ncbi:hypothetical protein E2562_020887 [Oryza meyeriana var. granulata]|uniref:Uncharacterized protein n=1 Tax=Oryza meyeriana var. granulata TaxID=110450 RepID=A0A6G1D4P5_9ORYZ|nr:hypothetical protein E2562_020887 [Oryza meyeriana var. granulata]
MCLLAAPLRPRPYCLLASAPCAQKRRLPAGCPCCLLAPSFCSQPPQHSRAPLVQNSNESVRWPVNACTCTEAKAVGIA